MSNLVISIKPKGLHGCSCHPFENWEEHDHFHKQKIQLGKTYTIRHTGVECIAKALYSDNKNFVQIFVFPYDCPRCYQLEHKSNLILKSQ